MFRYWPLSGFYLFYFGAVGVLAPYWALYLRARGCTAGQIGVLMALPLISRVLAPNLWSAIADRTRDPIAVVRWATTLAAVAFAGVFFARHAFAIGVATIGFTFFWHASLPQLEAATLTAVGHDYGRVRLWGSIGFIVVALALGALLDHVSATWIAGALWVLLIGVAILSFTLERPVIVEPPPLRVRFLRRVARRPVLVFLAGCFLMQASHGPYYTFYTLDLVAHGYPKGLVGFYWAFAVVCEIAVFFWGRHLFERINLKTLFLACFAAGMVRWVVIAGFVNDRSVIFLAQILHAATFGLYHATAVQIALRYFRGPYRNRGQALYGSAAGAGGAVGSLYSGWAWHALGPGATFGIAALLDAAALTLLWTALPGRPLAAARSGAARASV